MRATRVSDRWSTHGIDEGGMKGKRQLPGSVIGKSLEGDITRSNFPESYSLATVSLLRTSARNKVVGVSR